MANAIVQSARFFRSGGNRIYMRETKKMIDKDIIIKDILAGKYEILPKSLCSEHFGIVLHFRNNKQYIAVHCHIGFVENRYYMGYPGAETPIIKEEYDAMEKLYV